MLFGKNLEDVYLQTYDRVQNYIKALPNSKSQNIMHLKRGRERERERQSTITTIDINMLLN